MAAQAITEITLAGRRVFPESITSTPHGTLIVGSLEHGKVLDRHGGGVDQTGYERQLTRSARGRIPKPTSNSTE
jgi:hypothetical protein